MCVCVVGSGRSKWLPWTYFTHFPHLGIVWWQQQSADAQWQWGQMGIGWCPNGCAAMGAGVLHNSVSGVTLQSGNGQWHQWV